MAEAADPSLTLGPQVKGRRQSGFCAPVDGALVGTLSACSSSPCSSELPSQPEWLWVKPNSDGVHRRGEALTEAASHPTPLDALLEGDGFCFPVRGSEVLRSSLQQ